MASPIKSPSVTLPLNGRTWILRFNLNTYASYDLKTGKSFFDALGNFIDAIEEVRAKQNGNKAFGLREGLALFRRISMADLRMVLWASMQQDQPDVTPEEVGELIDHRNLPALINAVLGGQSQGAPTEAEAKAEQTQRGQGEGEGEEVPPENPTPVIVEVGGEASGPSGGSTLG